MDTENTSEIYKISSIDSDGRDITIYVLPRSRRINKRMMLEEYGNVEEEGMAIADLPDDVRAAFEQSRQQD